MEDIVREFLVTGDAAAHQRVNDYFGGLKASPDGWKQIGASLMESRDMDDTCKFFCLSVIEFYVQYHYAEADQSEQACMRTMILQLISHPYVFTRATSFVTNKFSQITAQIVLIDFPTRWPNFFVDLMSVSSKPAWNIYLRILTAINQEIAERDIPRSTKDVAKGTLIKDTMRETCVAQLVESWYKILTNPECDKDRRTQCLETMKMFIPWIDLNLIYNNRYMTLLIDILRKDRYSGDAVAECFIEIIQKGMEPGPKIQLVSALLSILSEPLTSLLGELTDDDIDLEISLSKLLGAMATDVIVACQKISPKRNSPISPEADAILQQGHELMDERLFPVVGKFFFDDDDDISGAVVDSLREYIQYLKHRGAGPKARANIVRIIHGIVEKYTYAEDYNFNTMNESEVEFIEFRQTLKLLFNNVAQLDAESVHAVVSQALFKALNEWNTLPFQNAEVGLACALMAAEAIPNDDLKRHYVNQIVKSTISNHPHASVRLQYFEILGRFEKHIEEASLPALLSAFLDERGLRSPNANLRSRCSYLFWKLVRSRKLPQAGEMLVAMRDLLVIPSVREFDSRHRLSNDDQLFLYEAAATLLVSSCPFKDQEQLFRELLSPAMQSYVAIAEELSHQSGPRRLFLAEIMRHAISVTTRTSKAFSTANPMQDYNCMVIYTEAIVIFQKPLITASFGDPAITMVHAGLRQYLHRMVLCLSDKEMLLIMPQALSVLLGLNVPSASDDHLLEFVKPIQDTIPLLVQMITKYGCACLPMLKNLFMPTVGLIFRCLQVHIDESNLDTLKDRQMLQRAYFNLIHAMVLKELLTAVITPDESSSTLEQVFNTIIQGAVNYPDPVSQKVCFSILRRMIETWGKDVDNMTFVRFIYDAILPACFQAPLQETFDLEDAQTALVLAESGVCMQSIYKFRGSELIMFLGSDFLPKLNLDLQQIEEYCANLTQENKVFKRYLKTLFDHLRKRGRS